MTYRLAVYIIQLSVFIIVIFSLHLIEMSEVIIFDCATSYLLHSVQLLVTDGNLQNIE